MMKKNKKLYQTIGKMLVIVFIFFLIFILLEKREYTIYQQNYNKKLASLIYELKEKYPLAKESEFIELLNKEEDIDYLKKYGIDIEKDTVIIKNEKEFKKNIIFISIVLILFIAIYFILFIRYEKRRSKQIKELTEYVEEVNKRNYSLKLDEFTEDELSILRSEIYKTTVMLKEALEYSKKGNKELKNALDDISHQIKTPLTSILISLDNLIDDNNISPSLKNEFLHDIKRQVLNLNFLIDTMLKLSKMDANTISYKKEKVNIKTILNDAIKNVSSLCDLKNINIELLNNEDSFLKVDVRWQIEAFTNILKNSIEHSKEFSKVKISYEKNAAYVKIMIKDEGEGINENILPHIFERFFGSNLKNESVGIGLALAKKIINDNNGTIKAYNNKIGSTFEIKYFNY